MYEYLSDCMPVHCAYSAPGGQKRAVDPPGTTVSEIC